jgi:hypothetical protein
LDALQRQCLDLGQSARAFTGDDQPGEETAVTSIPSRKGCQMPSYRVRFINEIPRNERLFRCCQRSIIIRSARTPERAIEAAKKRFARLEGISNWKIHAGLIEIEPIHIE